MSTTTTTYSGSDKKIDLVLWTVQVLLALLFLFAGGMKFVMSVEQMTAQAPVQFSGAFLHFIGAAELSGALGLVLPGLTRIRRELTPVAAAGLVIIMVGAVVTTIVQGQPGAIVPALVGVLAAYVAWGRSRRV